MIEQRQKEINLCLIHNLSHNLTATLTIIYNDPVVEHYLNLIRLPKREKLRLVYLSGEPTLRRQMLHISKYMQGKTIILMHMDNQLGEGTDLIDTKRFQSGGICYALTRRVKENTCTNPTYGTCNEGVHYTGSHDAFVFSFPKKLPESTFDMLTFSSNSIGQENALIYFFKMVLHYKVQNPCKIVQIMHTHCGVRMYSSGGRVNKRLSAVAPPSPKL